MSGSKRISPRASLLGYATSDARTCPPSRGGQFTRKTFRVAALAFLSLVAFVLFVASAPAAEMTGSFTNSYGQAVTNYFLIYPALGSTANANGSWTLGGPPKRVTPGSNGQWTNTLMEGRYVVTNP